MAAPCRARSQALPRGPIGSCSSPTRRTRCVSTRRPATRNRSSSSAWLRAAPPSCSPAWRTGPAAAWSCAGRTPRPRPWVARASASPAPRAGPSCGADDTYRIRAYDATLRGPRFNNAGSQRTGAHPPEPHRARGAGAHRVLEGRRYPGRVAVARPAGPRDARPRYGAGRPGAERLAHHQPHGRLRGACRQGGRARAFDRLQLRHAAQRTARADAGCQRWGCRFEDWKPSSSSAIIWLRSM